MPGVVSLADTARLPSTLNPSLTGSKVCFGDAVQANADYAMADAEVGIPLTIGGRLRNGIDQERSGRFAIGESKAVHPPAVVEIV